MFDLYGTATAETDALSADDALQQSRAYCETSGCLTIGPAGGQTTHFRKRRIAVQLGQSGGFASKFMTWNCLEPTAKTVARNGEDMFRVGVGSGDFRRELVRLLGAL